MPITEGAPLDEGMVILDYYLDRARADDSLYRQRAEMRRAEERAVSEAAAAREKRRERMRFIASLKRRKNPGSRPWQAFDGQFKTKQEWMDAGSPAPKGVTR